MKKPIFYFVVSVITVGFALGISPAHASSSMVQPSETEAQSMVILKQSLDILGNVLNQLDASLKTGQPQDTAQISVALAAIQTRLAGIQASLTDSGRSLARGPSAVPAPHTSAMSAGQKPLAAKSPSVMEETMPALPSSLDTEKMSGIAALSHSASAAFPATAAATSIMTPKNILLSAIGILAILAAVFFFRAREKDTPTETPTKTAS